MSFSVWKNVKIKDVAETIFSGGTPSTKKEEFWNGKINWLSSGETRNKFIVDTEKKITQEGVDNSSTKLAKKKDVVIASAGQGFTRGQTSMCLIDTYINQSLICVRAKKDIIDPYYLFYNISSRYNELRQISDGHSIRGSLTTKLISDLNISLPTIDEQRKIREILFSIDNKIETNNEINKKLEEMAQAIFKQWFVDFEFPNEDGKPYKSSGGEMVESELGMIPKGWEVIKLQDIGNLTMGLSPKSESYNAIGEGIPLLNGAADFYGGLIKATKYTTKETRVCKKNDLVFCIRATIGNITFADKEYCLGRGVASIESKKNLYVGIIYMNLSRSIERLKAQATGSVILGLSKPDINDMKLILPTKEILNKYSDIFKNAFDKKHILELENDKLINLRDTLLPKLMSGEIRVSMD